MERLKNIKKNLKFIVGFGVIYIAFTLESIGYKLQREFRKMSYYD